MVNLKKIMLQHFGSGRVKASPGYACR